MQHITCITFNKLLKPLVTFVLYICKVIALCDNLASISFKPLHALSIIIPNLIAKVATGRETIPLFSINLANSGFELSIKITKRNFHLIYPHSFLPCTM